MRRSDRSMLLKNRIINVAASIEGIEGIAVVWIQWGAQLDALGQIGVRDEVASKSHGIGITFFDDGFSTFRVKTAGGDDVPPINLS